MGHNVNDLRRESYVDDGFGWTAQKTDPVGWIGLPSDSVSPWTSYWLPSNPGSSSEYSRWDHFHGTPPLPTPAQIWAQPSEIWKGLSANDYTDADKSRLSGTSGSNSGDETVSSIWALVNAAPVAVPNDTDFVATAISWGTMNKISWTNVKAFLKTFFDWIYLTPSGSGSSLTGITSSQVWAPSGSGTSTGTNTGDQTITLTGDVTGSGTGSFAATLANSGVSAGSYTNANVTVDAKGRVTSISNGSSSGWPSPIISYSQPGTTFDTTADGFRIGRAGTLNSFTISLRSLPTGSNFTVDLKKNGTSVLSAPLSITTTESATNSYYTVSTGDTGKATISTSSFSAKDVFSLVVVSGTTFPGASIECTAYGTLS